MPDIRLPSEILPNDGRFGAGPAKIRPAALSALANSELLGTSHRQAPVRELVQQVQTGLLELFRAPSGYEIVLGNGGSTAFWDVAAHSLAEGNTQALVHGEFGSKFATALTAPFLSQLDIKNAEPGSRSSLQAVAGIKNYVYPQNETSTGVICEVSRVSGADTDALFFTDATSAAGGVDFDASETDVYYFAPQKNFASDGGLWLALLSPAAIARAEKIAKTDRYIPEFLSLKTAIDNSRQNQTLNTPAIATLILLREQINWLNSQGGLSWAAERTKTSSSLLYSWADSHQLATPFVSNPLHRSPVIVTIDFDKSIDAAEISKILRSHGIKDIDPYRKLGRNQLRIATFATIDPQDVAALISCIEYVMERLD